MRTTVTLDDSLFAKAAEIAGDSNASSLLTKALEMMVAAEAKKRLLRLSGAAPDFVIPGRDSRSEPLGKVAEGEPPYRK